MTKLINIPLPKPRLDFKALDVLKPGESILFPMSQYTSLPMCLSYRQRRYGKKFTRRIEDKFVRVWRVA